MVYSPLPWDNLTLPESLLLCEETLNIWVTYPVNLCPTSCKFHENRITHLNTISSICCRLFPVSYPNCPENCMLTRFCVMRLSDSDFLEKKTSCMQGVKRSIPKNFRIYPCTKSHLSCEFHANPYTSFFSVTLLTDIHTNKQSPTPTEMNT